MARIRKRKIALIVGLWIVIYLFSITVIYAIDTHFALNPWGDNDATILSYFLAGCFFFPGALRRYRRGRRGEQKIPWYHRPDFILCLIGLVDGPLFVLSVIQKWVDYILMSSDARIISIDNLHALNIALVIVTICWLALNILMVYSLVKRNKKTKTKPPQTMTPS